MNILIFFGGGGPVESRGGMVVWIQRWYGGMNDWDKYYVNRCMKSERVFALRPRKVGQSRSRLLIFKLIQAWWDAWMSQVVCKSVQEIRNYRAHSRLWWYEWLGLILCQVFALWPRKIRQGRSRSVLFELIQGNGGMHHRIQYHVNRCMKSEVIALTSFLTDARMDGRTDGRPAFLFPPPMANGSSSLGNLTD